MKDVLDDVERWLEQSHSVALATVVSTSGSSPRLPGTAMAVSSSGEVTGSIGGGCVEGAVVEEALAAIARRCRQGRIAQGKPRLLTYGIADELGLSVGLTCGGTIAVFVEPIQQKYTGDIPIGVVFDAIRKAPQKPVAICTIVEGLNAGAKMLVSKDAPSVGSLGSTKLDRVVPRDAQGLLAQRVESVMLNLPGSAPRLGWTLVLVLQKKRLCR